MTYTPLEFIYIHYKVFFVACSKDRSEVHIGEKVPRKDREDFLLRYLESKNIALPPKAVYRGIKRESDVTFSYRTTQRILQDLAEEGYLVRCDKDALDQGRIEPIPNDVEDRRTYYFITDKGRERIAADD